MASDASLSVRVLAGDFGAAEVTGLDVRVHPSNEAACDFVRATLWEHGVMCIRFSEPLSDDDARAVAQMIGPIKDPVGRTRDGRTLRYSEDRQIVDAGFVLTDELREQLGDVSFGGD